MYSNIHEKKKRCSAILSLSLSLVVSSPSSSDWGQGRDSQTAAIARPPSSSLPSPNSIREKNFNFKRWACANREEHGLGHGQGEGMYKWRIRRMLSPGPIPMEYYDRDVWSGLVERKRNGTESERLLPNFPEKLPLRSVKGRNFVASDQIGSRLASIAFPR